MSETDHRSDNLPRARAVLCVLVEVELDPASLDADTVARAAHAFAGRVAGQVVVEGVRAGAYTVKLIPCSLAGLTGALELAAAQVGA